MAGETLDVVWFDEEPAPEIYTEGLTRTNATNGMAYMTFTPLQGMSEVVMRFLHEVVSGSARHVHDDRRRGALHTGAARSHRRILSGA